MEATGTYDASFYLSGTLILLSAVICYPLKRINDWEKRRKTAQPDLESSWFYFMILIKSIIGKTASWLHCIIIIVINNTINTMNICN